MEKETVVRVAKVARIRLSEEELEKYGKDLEEILASFDILNSAPSEETYSFNPIPVADVLREDEPFLDIDPEELMKPMDTYEGYVRGPKLS